jgi:hypothetical protein
MSTNKLNNWYESDDEDIFSPENVKKFKEKWDKETAEMFNITLDDIKKELMEESSYAKKVMTPPLVKGRFTKPSMKK